MDTNQSIDKNKAQPDNQATGFTLECKFHFKSGHRGSKRMKQGTAPLPLPIEPGTIPRISRLMALAIHFEELIQRGEVQDYADLARLGFVTRARITQIMNLLNLAPDVQEGILFLPRVLRGREQITERDIRPIVAVTNWSLQRKMWAKRRKQQPHKSI